MVNTINLVVLICLNSVLRNAVCNERQSTFVTRKGMCFHEVEELIFEQCSDHHHGEVVEMKDGTYYRYNHRLYLRPTVSLSLPEPLNFEHQTISAIRNESHNHLIIDSSPAEHFILNVFNASVLEVALVRLKRSRWWNAEGFFFIEYISSPDNCEDLHSLFDVIWSFNILSVVVACLNSNFGVDLYSYNPFSETAPDFWHGIGHYREENGRLMTLFKNHSTFTGSFSSCSALYFDKTSKLENYPIKVCRSGVIMFNEIVNLVWTELGVNLTTTRIHHSSFGVIFNNSANGTIADVLRGKYDMSAIIDYERGFWRNNLQTFITKDLCYVVEREFLPMSSRLLRLYHPSVWIIKSVIILSLVALFTLISKQGIVWNLMNVFRATIGHAMLRPPKLLWVRIIMISFIFKQMVMINVSQSQLTSTLATDQYEHEGVIKDRTLIRDAGHYQIFGTNYFRQLFYSFGNENKSIGLVDDLDDCLALMKLRDNIICIENCNKLKFYKLDSTMSIIEDRLFSRNGVLLFRDDFPLQKRIRRVYQRLFERGIISYIVRKDSWQKEANKNKHLGEKSIMISLHKLRICFYILYVAHGCSFLVFLFEILFHHFKYSRCINAGIL